MKDSLLNIAILGATGYVGIELIKLLENHPKVKIKYLCAQKLIGKSVYSLDKKIISKNLPKVSKLNDIKWKNVNLVFTALPNGEAQKLAIRIPRKIKIIDLSADFRLDNSAMYKKWYKINHYSKRLIKKSIYSIPEFSKKKIYKYDIIGNPGCYPTSIQLPLIPLLQKKMINTNNIIVDSKSGYSGAGKNLEKRFKYKYLHESVSAYGVGSHKHMAELDQELSKAANKKIKVTFTPHLIPMFRGILSTIYLEMNKKVTAKKVYNFLRKYHKNNYFVKLAKFDTSINTGEVMNTNFCKISVCKNREKNKIIVISIIDNLVKGASGQAVQNMNIAYNFKETAGLL